MLGYTEVGWKDLESFVFHTLPAGIASMESPEHPAGITTVIAKTQSMDVISGDGLAKHGVEGRVD